MLRSGNGRCRVNSVSATPGWQPIACVERPAAPSRRSSSIIWSRSEEHTSELQSLMRISYAVFCLEKKIVTMARTINQVKDKHVVPHTLLYKTIQYVPYTQSLPTMNF